MRRTSRASSIRPPGRSSSPTSRPRTCNRRASPSRSLPTSTTSWRRMSGRWRIDGPSSPAGEGAERSEAGEGGVPLHAPLSPLGLRPSRPSPARGGGETLPAAPRTLGLLLVAPALALVAALFLYPLGFSLVAAFTAEGQPTLRHFEKAFELYATTSASRSSSSFSRPSSSR